MSLSKMLFLFILISFSYGCIAQNTDDFKIITNILENENRKILLESKSQNKINVSGYLPLLFSFYKNYVSSQDFNSCVYHPSCSAYAVEAIQKKGIINGSIMTFDRLTRCNPTSFKHYEVDMKLKRLKDHVE